MPGLTSADPHTLSTLSISRANSQGRSNGLISPSRNMDQGHASEQSRVDHRASIHRKEVLPRFDVRAAEESLSLYCKPIELYNIIQRRALRNPIFLQRCLRYKIEEARERRIKLTISAVKVATTACDARLNVGKSNGNGINVDDQVYQSVLLMLTTPVLSSGMGHSCFRLSQTCVLRTKSANLLGAENKGQPSVTFLLPEIQRLLLNAKRDGAVMVFITSAELNSTRNGNGGPIESSVNTSGSVMWGSIPLTTLCRNRLVMDHDGKDGDEAMAEMMFEDTLHVELFPSRLQLVNSADGRFVNFQSTASTSTAQSLARLQLCLSVQEDGKSLNAFKPVSGSFSSNGRFLNCPSLSQARRLQPGQVVFHYHYYFNQLYKSEVTENYSCPFCVRCCSSLKGLRCHLNSTHDLFTFEFLATSDYRLVNVFCRNDVLDQEGNVRDIDGLNDPRLKIFLYWSKCGRPRKSSIVVEMQAGRHQPKGQSPDLEMGLGGISDSQSKDRSRSALASPLTAKDKPFGPDSTLVKECPLPIGHARNSVCQVSSNEPVNTVACTASPCIAVSANVAENASLVQEQMKKHRISEESGNAVKVSEEALQALKKQRSDFGDSKSVSSVGKRYVGMAPNGVCLAIAAPRPTDKHSLQSAVNAHVLPFKSRPDKHRKSLVERSEARIRFQLQKRQFFHSHTGQPMAIEQLLSDRDSEDENDEAIMDLEDRRMLDDFVDVTRDEKELMHLWNSFVRKQRVLADGHCPWACEAFTKLHAENFHKSLALRRCLMLFLIKLWNHNLVDGNTINRCLVIVDSFNETRERDVLDTNQKL